MNLRRLVFSVAAAVLVLPMLVLAQAADGGLVPCGDRGDMSCQGCHFVELLNNVSGWLVGVLSIAAAIMFMIAGYRLVTAGGNQSVMKSAKDMIVNVTIGFVIVLAAWLLIDFVMRSLLVGGNTAFGPWNAIQCVPQPTPGVVTDSIPVVDVASLTAAGIVGDASLAPDTYAAGDCSPANLQSLGMNATQAQVFSCMAQPESGCNLNADNPDSTARGVFQILRGYNNPCHNLNLPACTAAAQAAGWTGAGNLNCSTAFRGGHAISGDSLAAICDAAASNMACNTAAALCLYDDAGGYGPWLNLTNIGSNSHTVQRACVARYGG